MAQGTADMLSPSSGMPPAHIPCTPPLASPSSVLSLGLSVSPDCPPPRETGLDVLLCAASLHCH